MEAAYRTAAPRYNPTRAIPVAAVMIARAQ